MALVRKSPDDVGMDIHISHALEESLVLVLFFFMALPALVASLVAFAMVVASGERAAGTRRS
jgi:hypothetical protein